jgi:N-succinyldiaminopimelate aminotransferase
MNPLLSHLQPYPFERLRQLFQDIVPNPAYRPISLGIGEPKHATPAFILDALDAAGRATPSGLASYPATAGDLKLRQSFTGWLQRRYGLLLDAATQTLPVNGTREALFALAQTVVDPRPGYENEDKKPWVICPNPFYQIYEGAAILSGARPWFVPAMPSKNFAPDWDSVPSGKNSSI